METQTSLTLLLVFCKGYISPKSFYNLLRLFTSNVDRSNEKKWFYTKKKKSKKQTIARTNYYGRRLCRWHRASRKYTNQAESLLHSLEQAAGCLDHHVNADKIKYMCFNQKEDLTTLNGGSLKLVDKFTNLGSRVPSTENDINMRLARTAIDMLLILWKSNLSDKIQRNFFRTAVMSILRYGCTTEMLMKRIEKKLQECYEQYWTNPGSDFPQSSSCIATNLSSLKPSR